MDNKNLVFAETEIEKHTFHQHQNPILIYYADIR